MKFTISWLRKFLEFDASVEELSERLTSLGLEVEEVVDRSKELADFEVAEILEANPHPDASKLQICKVNSSIGELQIVCGAPNARKGIKVVLAKVGTNIPNGNFKIKQASIRGVESSGMLCSEEELLIGKDSNGIIELPLNAKVGDKFAKYYGLDDPMIEIAITANRGDCLGVYGIARDLAASGFGTLKHPDVTSVKGGFNSNFTVKVECPEHVPIFIAREFKDIKNGQSPEWLQSLLTSIGVSPISALVDITNYISYSFGRPMHAYDKDKLSGGFTIKHAQNGEEFLALNDKTYTITSEKIIVADNNGAQALGGIIGGKNSSCSEDTRNVILESAIFDPISVAKSGRRHQIDTDARYRFERKTDPEFVDKAMEIATRMILDICGGQASQNIVAGSAMQDKAHINISLSQINDYLGTHIHLAEIDNYLGKSITKSVVQEILEKLGFEVNAKDDNFSLKVPSWRNDINIKEDVIEEIARIYGYDNLPSYSLPIIEGQSLSNGLYNGLQTRVFIARRAMTTLGYDEVVTWSFMHHKDAEKFAVLKEELFVINPISSELNYMRPSIIPNLIGKVANNRARSIENSALFEIGPVFESVLENGEQKVLAGIVSGNRQDKNIYHAARPVDVFDVKGDLEALFADIEFEFGNLQIDNNVSSLPYLHPGRSALLKLGGKNIVGYFGQIHPIIANSMDVPNNSICFEIYLSKLPLAKKKSTNKPKYQESIYQPVERDFAFLVGRDIQVGDIQRAISAIDKNLVKSVDIFDIYQGDKIAEDKKSVAIKVIIQSMDRTLTDEEIKALSEKVISIAADKFQAVLRS